MAAGDASRATRKLSALGSLSAGVFNPKWPWALCSPPGSHQYYDVVSTSPLFSALSSSALGLESPWYSHRWFVSSLTQFLSAFPRLAQILALHMLALSFGGA